MCIYMRIHIYIHIYTHTCPSLLFAFSYFVLWHLILVSLERIKGKNKHRNSMFVLEHLFLVFLERINSIQRSLNFDVCSHILNFDV